LQVVQLAAWNELCPVIRPPAQCGTHCNAILGCSEGTNLSGTCTCRSPFVPSAVHYHAIWMIPNEVVDRGCIGIVRDLPPRAIVRIPRSVIRVRRDASIVRVVRRQKQKTRGRAGYSALRLDPGSTTAQGWPTAQCLALDHPLRDFRRNLERTRRHACHAHWDHSLRLGDRSQARRQPGLGMQDVCRSVRGQEHRPCRIMLRDDAIGVYVNPRQIIAKRSLGGFLYRLHPVQLYDLGQCFRVRCYTKPPIRDLCTPGIDTRQIEHGGSQFWCSNAVLREEHVDDVGPIRLPRCRV
jgi:hypothetical protein